MLAPSERGIVTGLINLTVIVLATIGAWQVIKWLTETVSSLRVQGGAENPDRHEGSTFLSAPTRDRRPGGDDSVEIGWHRGHFSDGRPYLAECWAMDGVTLLTFFFSRDGLETLDDERAGDLLARESVVEFLASRYVEARPIEDDAGEEMWSVTVVIGDDEDLFAESSLELQPYPERN